MPTKYALHTRVSIIINKVSNTAALYDYLDNDLSFP